MDPVKETSMRSTEIGSQSCKEKSLYPNYTHPLIWFPFLCLSLFYSCAFFMKAFKGAYSLTSCKKNVRIQLHYRAGSWKRRQSRSWLVSCFLSSKAICCSALHLLKEKPPDPSHLSQSLCCQLQSGSHLGNSAEPCVPQRERVGPSGTHVRWGMASTCPQA